MKGKNVKMKTKSNAVKSKNFSNGQSKAPVPVNIDKIVVKINKIAVETVEKGAMEIGDLVLKEVFGGSLSAALSRNPNKDVSLQEICNHRELRVNRRTLGLWVRAANLRKALITDKVDCSNLRYSHFTVLLRVTNAQKRKEFAKEANQGKLSSRKTTELIEGMKQKRNANSNGNGKKDTHESEDRSRELIRMVENPFDLAAKEAAQRFSAELKSLLEVESGNRWDILKVIDSVLEKIGKSSEFLNRLKHSLISNNLDDLNPEQV